MVIDYSNLFQLLLGKVLTIDSLRFHLREIIAAWNSNSTAK